MQLLKDPWRIFMEDASTRPDLLQQEHPRPPPQERAWRYQIKEDQVPADLSGELNSPASQEHGTGQTNRFPDEARREFNSPLPGNQCS